MGIIGAILGDIAGSFWEFNRGKAKADWNTIPLFTNASKFTDDTVMSIACKKTIDNGVLDFETNYRAFGKKYPYAGYGHLFRQWIKDDTMGPYNSFGNGSAMRVSYVGECVERFEDVAAIAAASAVCTHNHPEGIKGAVAVAQAVWMAEHGSTKEDIKNFISKTHGYNLNRTLDEIRPTYKWSSTCQGSVPEAIICFLEGTSYEDTLRKAISLQGDTDTMCCIAGAIAESFYGTTGMDNMSLLSKYLDEFLLKELYYGLF